MDIKTVVWGQWGQMYSHTCLFFGYEGMKICHTAITQEMCILFCVTCALNAYMFNYDVIAAAQWDTSSDNVFLEVSFSSWDTYIEMASFALMHGVIAFWELDTQACPGSFGWCEHGWVNQADWVETGKLFDLFSLIGTFELSALCVKQVDCVKKQNAGHDSITSGCNSNHLWGCSLSPSALLKQQKFSEYNSIKGKEWTGKSQTLRPLIGSSDTKVVVIPAIWVFVPVRRQSGLSFSCVSSDSQHYFLSWWSLSATSWASVCIKNECCVSVPRIRAVFVHACALVSQMYADGCVFVLAVHRLQVCIRFLLSPTSDSA